MASKRDKRIAAIERALALATEALDLLDAHEGPPTAAVHLEMCRDKLREELAKALKYIAAPYWPLLELISNDWRLIGCECRAS